MTNTRTHTCSAATVRLLGAGLLLCVAALGCSKQQAPFATVDGKSIDKTQFDAYLKLKRIPERPNAQLERVLDEYLTREALAVAVERAGKLDKAMVDAELNEFRKEMLISRYFEKYLDDKVTDQAVRNFYESNVANYEEKKIHVAHILVRTNPKQSDEERQAKLTAAQEAYSLLKSGKEFAAVAETHSEDSELGQEGWRPRLDQAGQHRPRLLEEGVRDAPGRGVRAVRVAVRLSRGEGARSGPDRPAPVRRRLGRHPPPAARRGEAGRDRLAQVAGQDRAQGQAAQGRRMTLFGHSRVAVRRLAACSLVLVPLAFACGKDEADASLPGDETVVAKVNDTPITLYDVDATARRTLGEQIAGTLDGKGKRKVLESLVQARAVAHLVERELDASELAALEKRVAAFREELLVQAYLERHITPTPVSGDMVRAYYDRHKDQFGGKRVLRYEMLRAVAYPMAPRVKRCSRRCAASTSKATGPH